MAELSPTTNADNSTRHAHVQCPRCAQTNSAEAVFCRTPGCGKALGGFRYVLEEVDAKRNLLGRLAVRSAQWIGHPHFVTLHLIAFAAWAWLNAGLWRAIPVFDPFPYGLLGIILAIEAALITSLLLIEANQRSEFESIQAELQYEVSVKSHRLLDALSQRLLQVDRRITRLEGDGHD